ncbi:MAG: IS200/IS605 family transposase [Ignavibacteriae bacterium]|nr:IS200/IS605 family transposase [Ignavibacteria bacterium]MBI3364865.1 IS200/IS605 family transposase [Ignavibacteriota bacterium]
MPYTKIWIHLIWSTKNREPMLQKDFRSKLFDHIRENVKGKGIHLDTMNGYLDHVHTLIRLKPDQSVARVAQLLKGESSHWVNDQKLTGFKFEWQDEYIALSVSESQLDKVREYIKNQEEHHRKKTFAEEYEQFMKKYGFNEEG